MWWIFGIAAYLVLVILLILFLRAASRAEDQICRLEGIPETAPSPRARPAQKDESQEDLLKVGT